MIKKASEKENVFRRAFLEAANEEINGILKISPQKPRYSKRHLRTMEKIISGKSMDLRPAAEKRFKKRLIAVLIAALLLLACGITVYANRDAITRFVVNIFDGYNEVTYVVDPNEDTDIPQEIEEERIPTYLPEGYVLQEKDASMTAVRMMWAKKEQYIIFAQGTMGSIYVIDNEHGEQTTLTIDSCPVYLKKNDDSDLYLWTDDKYTYSIECFGNLSFDEASKMIQSIPKGKD